MLVMMRQPPMRYFQNSPSVEPFKASSTLGDKDELENLTPKQKATLKQLLKDELEARK